MFIMKYTRHKKKTLLIGCFVIYVSHELSKTAKYGVKLMDSNTFDIQSSLHWILIEKAGNF